MKKLKQNHLQRAEDDSQRKPKKWKWIVLLFLFFSFLMGIYFIWIFFQTPAVGVIHTGFLPKKEESFDQGTEVKQFKGQFFHFSYSGKYTEVSHTVPTSGPIKEMLLLSATDTEGKKIAVTFEKRPEFTLDASPAFQMRQNDKKQYVKSTFSSHGLDNVLFTKDSQVFEKTLFLHQKNIFLILSVSSPFSSEALLDDIEDIVRTLEWGENI